MICVTWVSWKSSASSNSSIGSPPGALFRTRRNGCRDTACRVRAVLKRPVFFAGRKNRSGRPAGRSTFRPALRGARAGEDAGVVRDRSSAGNRREPIRGRSLRSTGKQTRLRRLQARTPDDRRRSCCKPGRSPRPFPWIAHRCRQYRIGAYCLEHRRESCGNERHDDAGNDRRFRDEPKPLPCCADRTASPPPRTPATGATAQSAQTGWISSDSCFLVYVTASGYSRCSEPGRAPKFLYYGPKSVIFRFEHCRDAPASAIVRLIEVSWQGTWDA